MTPEQKRIAIAEACPGRFKYFGGTGWWYSVDGKDWLRYVDGDLLSDLNAVPAALKAQTQAFRAEFDKLLHAMAEEKHLLVTELEAKDWADCFISCLQSQ